jgi:hypothetical protein
MSRLRAVLLLSAIWTVIADAEPPPTSEAAAQLERMTQELYDAVAPGRTDVWQRYLDDAVLYLDENGVLLTKAELLAELRPLPAGLVGRIDVANMKVTLHGDTAVTAHDADEHLDYHGQAIHTVFRSTMTWRRRAGSWRLVQAQVLAVLEDPPSIKMDQERLCAYGGSYRLTPAIHTRVRCDAEQLVFERDGRPAARYAPEAPDLFFTHGQPRSRKVFLRDASGAITGFADRREGHDIVWTKEAAPDVGDRP